MGIFYNHKCKTCGVKYPNHRMRSKGGRYQCEDCARDEGLERRKARKAPRGRDPRK